MPDSEIRADLVAVSVPRQLRQERRVFGLAGPGLAALTVLAAPAVTVLLLVGELLFLSAAATLPWGHLFPRDFSLLVFAALGANLSRRFFDRPRRFLRVLLLSTVGLIVAEVLMMPWIRDALLGTSLAVRIAFTMLLQLPLGVVLGMFFPTGLEIVRRVDPTFVPWAWAINGVGSVIATVLAVILGMEIGFAGVAVVAAGIYAIGTLAMLSALKETSRS